MQVVEVLVTTTLTLLARGGQVEVVLVVVATQLGLLEQQTQVVAVEVRERTEMVGLVALVLSLLATQQQPLWCHVSLAHQGRSPTPTE
jgi:hypothetical protein